MLKIVHVIIYQRRWHDWIMKRLYWRWVNIPVASYNHDVLSLTKILQHHKGNSSRHSSACFWCGKMAKLKTFTLFGPEISKDQSKFDPDWTFQRREGRQTCGNQLAQAPGSACPDVCGRACGYWRTVWKLKEKGEKTKTRWPGAAQLVYIVRWPYPAPAAFNRTTWTASAPPETALLLLRWWYCRICFSNDWFSVSLLLLLFLLQQWQQQQQHSEAASATSYAATEAATADIRWRCIGGLSWDHPVSMHCLQPCPWSNDTGCCTTLLLAPAISGQVIWNWCIE